jgi:hypothetical protein
MFASLSRQLLLKQLDQLIADFGGSTGPLSEAISINHDVGLKGVDADGFVTEIQKRYGTRFEGYVGKKYFQSDSEAQLDIRPGMFGKKSETQPLTVGHLLDVIQKGAWFDPGGGLY